MERLRTARNIAIVIAIALAVDLLPGGGRAATTFEAILLIGFGACFGSLCRLPSAYTRHPPPGPRHPPPPAPAGPPAAPPSRLARTTAMRPPPTLPYAWAS